MVVVYRGGSRDDKVSSICEQVFHRLKGLRVRGFNCLCMILGNRPVVRCSQQAFQGEIKRLIGKGRDWNLHVETSVWHIVVGGGGNAVHDCWCGA